jgi:hypothetical protein
VADLTRLLPADDRIPADTWFIVRRERPHPGAQLDLFDIVEGFRHRLISTDSPAGSGTLPWLDARYRAHARIEDLWGSEIRMWGLICGFLAETVSMGCGQAAIWYSWVSPPRTAFRRIR